MSEAGPIDREALIAALGGRSIVLVGMMGAGKTSVGRRMAARLDLPFVDADAEIEAGAQMSVPEIFERFGEPYFREGERRVVARLLAEGQKVLATGGGAFMNEATRQRIADSGVSIWLKPDFEVLMRRVRKRSNRPLLKTTDPGTRYFLVKQGKDIVIARIDLSGMDDIIHILSGRAETVAILDEVRAEVGDDPEIWIPEFVRRVKRL